MGTTAEKINYAINATNDIAEGINNIGGNITQNTELADFKDELDKLYSEMPKVTQSGTSISLANTRKGKIGITPKGNIEQEEEPTPDYPQDIKVVKGENTIHIGNITKTLNLGNIELAKINDYSNLIFKNEKTNPYYDNTLVENAWYEKQIIKPKVYDENANFQLGSASTNDYYVFQTAYGYDIPDAKQIGNSLICDNFEYSDTEENYQREYVTINPNAYSYIRFHIASSRLSEKSVNAFRNWLETHNVLIYYILENPIYTQITDTTLISQLEEINSIIGQGGTVVIETESEEENAQLIVNASALASFENS